MDPKTRLEAIIRRKLAAALRAHLEGDWSRPPQTLEEAGIPRAMFDAWADSVELPHGRVSKERSREDGIYVLRDADGWLVFEQQGGAHRPGERVHATYKEARRAALALDLLAVLRGRG